MLLAQVREQMGGIGRPRPLAYFRPRVDSNYGPRAYQTSGDPIFSCARRVSRRVGGTPASSTPHPPHIAIIPPRLRGASSPPHDSASDAPHPPQQVKRL